MPRLQFFIPCDRVLVNKEDQDLSIIGVLDGLSIEIEDPKLPDNGKTLSLPHNWTTIAQWRRVSGDEKTAFQQRVQIVLPNGKLSGQSLSSTIFLTAPIAVLASRGTALPFIGSGTYLFRLSYRLGVYKEQEKEKGWKTASEYPISITAGSSKKGDSDEGIVAEGVPQDGTPDGRGI